MADALKFNMYVDGSWLFRLCGAEKLLAHRTEFPGQRFRLDFSKLIELVGGELAKRIGEPRVEPDQLFYYTALFQIPADIDEDWPDISVIRRSTEARSRFLETALGAGFLKSGVFYVPLRRWMVEKLADRRYQEKMVDTSLVARLVERTINAPESIHVVVSGDLDMLPGISTVVPDYSKKVVLLTTHPDQYDRAEAQSSYKLSQFRFDYEPIYIDQHVEDIIQGAHIYRCSNRACNCVFTRSQPVPRGRNPVCKPCFENRPGAA